jgi:8-oxo-dGTP diphosphatase
MHKMGAKTMRRKTKHKPPDSEEQKFLAQYDASQFPHPSVTVDVALLTAEQGELRALLIKRQEYPERGKWSLPGGFITMDESLDEAALRVLSSKIGLTGIFLEQLYTFGEPKRDPRTRIISVAYYSLVDSEKLSRSLGEKKDILKAIIQVPWQGETGGPVTAVDEQQRPVSLAFDHAEILGLVMKRLRGKLNYVPIGFELLPRRFTLRQLQVIHETILNRRSNKDSFRRRMLASGLIASTGKREAKVGHRPAELYQFKRQSVTD